MSIFKSKRHKETSPKEDTSESDPQDRELTHTLSLPLFGEGAVVVPPSMEPPKFGDELYEIAVASMIEVNAPRRFAVVAHDKEANNSAVLAWGLDYGDNDIYIDSAHDNTRWQVSKPEDVFKYFSDPPEPDCLQILWIDGPGGLVHWRRSSWGMKGIGQGITTFLGFSKHGDELIRAAVEAVRVADDESRNILQGSSNPNTYAATASYFAAEHSLAEAGAHLAKADYHARHYRDSV